MTRGGSKAVRLQDTCKLVFETKVKTEVVITHKRAPATKLFEETGRIAKAGQEVLSHEVAQSNVGGAFSTG